MHRYQCKRRMSFINNRANSCPESSETYNTDVSNLHNNNKRMNTFQSASPCKPNLWKEQKRNAYSINIDVEELLVEEKRKNDIDCLRKKNSELKALLNSLQNEIATCKEDIAILGDEQFYNRTKIKELEMQLDLKRMQIDEDRNRSEMMKHTLNEYQKQLVDAFEEIKILKEKLQKTQKDILEHQVQMTSIHRISGKSCAKYIFDISPSEQATIENQLLRAKDKMEHITNETAKVLSHYACEKDSIETIIQRLEKHDCHELQTCEESTVSIEKGGLSCSDECFVKKSQEYVKNEMLPFERKDYNSSQQIPQQKQISQTIVHADKVYINSAVSNSITESDVGAIEEYSL